MLTSSRCNAWTCRGTGSLSASPPAAIRIEDRPPKCSECIVPGTDVALLPAMATDAAPTRRGREPKAFVNRTRTRSPPAVRKTMLRTVWLFRPLSAGQVKAGAGMVPPGTGLPCQAFTQRAPPCLPSWALTEPAEGGRAATEGVVAAWATTGAETVAKIHE